MGCRVFSGSDPGFTGARFRASARLPEPRHARLVRRFPICPSNPWTLSTPFNSDGPDSGCGHRGCYAHVQRHQRFRVEASSIPGTRPAGLAVEGQRPGAAELRFLRRLPRLPSGRGCLSGACCDTAFPAPAPGFRGGRKREGRGQSRDPEPLCSVRGRAPTRTLFPVGRGCVGWAGGQRFSATPFGSPGSEEIRGRLVKPWSWTAPPPRSWA